MQHNLYNVWTQFIIIICCHIRKHKNRKKEFHFAFLVDVKFDVCWLYRKMINSSLISKHGDLLKSQSLKWIEKCLCSLTRQWNYICVDSVVIFHFTQWAWDWIVFLLFPTKSSRHRSHRADQSLFFGNILRFHVVCCCCVCATNDKESKEIKNLSLKIRNHLPDADETYEYDEESLVGWSENILETLI